MQVAQQLCEEAAGRESELSSLLQRLLREYSKRLVNPKSEAREVTIALRVVGALTPAVAHLLGQQVRIVHVH